MASHQITIEQILEYNLEEPIQEILFIECHELGSAYLRAASQETEKSSQKYDLYSMLQQLCYMHLKPEDRAHPYGPLWMSGNQRSAQPCDFRGQKSGILSQWVPHIKHPVLRARIADIAWLNNRKMVECGRAAIVAYVECIDLLINGKFQVHFEEKAPWNVTAVDYLRRAMTIAFEMGHDKPEAQIVRDAIIRVVDLAKIAGNAFGYARIAKLAWYFDIVDASLLGNTLREFAQELRSKGEFMFASDIFSIAATAFQSVKDEIAKEQSISDASECLVELSDTDMPAMNKSHWLADAIEKLRLVKGSKQRREQIKQKLRDAQSNISDEMGVFSIPQDLTDVIKESQNKLLGKSFIEALFTFATLTTCPDVNDLRDNAIKSAANSPILSMMGANSHSADGKLIAKVSGYDPENPSDVALRRLILQDETYRRQVVSKGAIDPGRQIIFTEHPLDTPDLLLLVQYSPFVPPDRRLIFARGFARFLGGDNLTASHLLLPQVENSLRYALIQNGVDPTTLKDDMTQQDASLSVLLKNFRNELEQVFGNAIIFDLENILDIGLGPKLRHSLAHGLLSDDDFRSYDVTYACWLIFHLCALPLFGQRQQIVQMYKKQYITNQ